MLTRVKTTYGLNQKGEKHLLASLHLQQRTRLYFVVSEGLSNIVSIVSTT